MKFEKGTKFENKKGIVIEIIAVEENYIQFSLNGKVQDCTPAGLETMLKVNGYEEDETEKILAMAKSIIGNQEALKMANELLAQGNLTYDEATKIVYNQFFN